MKIDGKHYRTIWIHPQNPKIVQIIDQRKLPFQFVIKDLEDLESAEKAISDMLVRGAEGDFELMLEEDVEGEDEEAPKTIEEAHDQLLGKLLGK